MAYGLQGPRGIQTLPNPLTAGPVPAPPAAGPTPPRQPQTTTPQPPPSPAPEPLPNLAANPAWLEFARTLGLSQADAQAASQLATTQVGANLSNTLARNAQANRLAQARLASGEEGRGILRSGQSLTGAADLGAAQGYQQEALRQQAAERISQLATNLALQIQAGNAKGAELGLSQAPADLIANALPGDTTLSTDGA